jgi:hypothetical protein
MKTIIVVIAGAEVTISSLLVRITASVIGYVMTQRRIVAAIDPVITIRRGFDVGYVAQVVTGLITGTLQIGDGHPLRYR